MLDLFASRNNINSRAFVVPIEPPISHIAKLPVRRKSTRSTPLLAAAGRVVQPRPTIRSTFAVNELKSPESHGPHLIKTPWELERHTKHKPSKSAEHELPVTIFKHLPREVYECIITQLEQLHLHQDGTCSACYLRDLHSLSLVSRAWDKVTISPMYRRVLLFADEENTKLPKLKIRGTSRLKLLRRTLRERPTLARSVRELHLSGFQTLFQKATIEQGEIVSSIASLVMACPNLERLVGFHIPFTHSFDRLSHALSTRSKLKEKLLSESTADQSEEDEDEELSAYYLASCDPTERFLEINSNHSFLATLVLQQQDRPHNASAFNFRAIVGTLRKLPKLRQLAISSLPYNSFTNLTLSALPPNLKSLRLENLPGIDDKGLQRFITSKLMTTIETLVLIDLEISSLVTISYILSTHSGSLKNFTLAQYRAPSIPSNGSIPDFNCPTLEYMHWEVRSDAGPLPPLPLSTVLDVSKEPAFPFTNLEPISCLATCLLAQSIRDDAFPSLRRIRIPHDPQGLIQTLCKPLSTALLPCDIAMLHSVFGGNGSKRGPVINDTCERPLSEPKDSATRLSSILRTDSVVEVTASENGHPQIEHAPTRSRIAAQARILAARKAALMKIRVYDPNGNLQINKAVRGFVGRIDSQIIYELGADRGCISGAADNASEQNQWIVNVEDFLDGQVYASTEARDKLFGSCGHRIGERTWKNAVMVDELFQGVLPGAD